MQRTKISTLVTLGKIIAKYNTNYCYASQNTLLDLLEKFQNIKIERRMLNYHLADLRREGLIKTIRRNSRRDDGTFCLLSSATCLTIKGARLLYKMGSSWALRHFNSLRKKYMPQKAADSKSILEASEHKSTEPTASQLKNPYLDQESRRKMGLSDTLTFHKKPV